MTNLELTEALASSIAKRVARRKLRLTLKHMKHFAGYVFDPAAGVPRGQALYVGVGHGHDALLALAEDRFAHIVGADPFKGGGNDDGDYQELLGLIREHGLEPRFEIAVGTVDDYLARSEATFDVILCPDVLHHIFVTFEPLRRTPHFAACAELFGRLAGRANPGARLIITDVHRHGLRPWLTNLGMLKGNIDYRSKQPWTAWVAAAEQAGWRLLQRRFYVPYALRNGRNVIENPIGGYTVCNRYVVHLVREQATGNRQ